MIDDTVKFTQYHEDYDDSADDDDDDDTVIRRWRMMTRMSYAI